MKITMYGAPICEDCVNDKEALLNCKDIDLDYKNITKDVVTLKEFLSYRDHDQLFEPITESGKIGIPFYILEDGTKTFDIYEFIDAKRPEYEPAANACSIDGKGSC